MTYNPPPTPKEIAGWFLQANLGQLREVQSALLESGVEFSIGLVSDTPELVIQDYDGPDPSLRPRKAFP